MKYPKTRKSKEIRFVDAISDALYEKMNFDKSTIIMGQDIAEYGGVFKITEGFLEKFGENRVKNTPIIESGIIGAAMGMSLEGFKPIVEMQFADFVSCGFNQIVNNLAKTKYRWEQGINVTIRMPAGGGMGAGPSILKVMNHGLLRFLALRLYTHHIPEMQKACLFSQ